MTRRKRSGLLLALGVPILLVAASAAVDGRLYLQLEHRIRSALEDEAVVTLDVGRASVFRMFLNPDDQAVSRTLARGRIWEPHETYWFQRIVQEGDTVIDIGANVGYYTLLGAALVGEEGRVYAFEPDPVAFALLERNVRLNGFSNVVIEQKAVSSEAGSIRLYLAEENKGDHRIYQTEVPRESIEIEAVTLDDYFDGYEGSIDFAKIDTQGAESAIVGGMQGIIEDNAGLRMVVEFWPYGLSRFGADAGALLGGLQSSGFQFFDVGIWGASTEGQLPKVEIAELLEQHTVENKTFTNLLLTRDGRQP